MHFFSSLKCKYKPIKPVEGYVQCTYNMPFFKFPKLKILETSGQLSGELRGQHLGEFQQRTSILFVMDSISFFIKVP